MKKSVLLRGAVCGALLLSVNGCSKIASMVGGGDGGSASPLSGGLSLAGFEGEIDLSITAKEKGKADKAFTVPMLIKSNKFRINEPAGIEGADKFGNVYAIVDSDAKKAYAVLDQPKEVIEIDLNKVGDQVKSMKPQSHTATKPGETEPPKYPPKIEKTGKTDTVAGFSCEIWNISSTEPGDKSRAEVCVSQQGVSFFHLPMTGAPAEMAALSELVDGAHFPMRAIGYDKDGVTEVGRMEVSKVDKKTLDAQTFTPPATYKVVDVATAVQGFMMGGMTGNPGEMGGPGMRGGGAFPTGHPPVHH